MPAKIELGSCHSTLCSNHFSLCSNYASGRQLKVETRSKLESTVKFRVSFTAINKSLSISLTASQKKGLFSSIGSHQSPQARNSYGSVRPSRLFSTPRIICTKSSSLLFVNTNKSQRKVIQFTFSFYKLIASHLYNTNFIFILPQSSLSPQINQTLYKHLESFNSPILMQKLIPIISQIQQIIRRSDVNLEVSLPMIAVVGSQSTGKSSLLESIIGKELLPKGKGIVTRRPIEIQLCQIQGEKQYAELVDKKGEHYHDMDEFRKLIDLQTQKACGQNKGISSVPLRIRLYSKKVLDLLLVDLPGIIKNPVGDQPKDIEQQVIKMVKGYIKNPNCIIVAVSKATDDSANSQSLKLAREIDKEGIRTVGVLTQVDLVDESINILKDYNTLSNKLSLGYTCVYLRPLKSNATLEEQYEKEAQFFRKHEQYQHFNQRMGVRSLIKTLNMVLVKHIKAELPVIRENLIYLLETKKSKMEEYGPYETITDKKTQGVLILSLVSKYVRYMIELIEGRYTDSREAVIGGARIEYIFSQVFIKSINKLDPFEYLTDNDIRTAIRNANGLRKSLFLPEAAFENLLRTQISRLKMPSLECAHLIHEELRRLIYSIKISEIERYENLNRRIFQVMEDLLAKSLKKTEDMIKNIIQIQLGYINTNHPDFIDVISLVKTSSDNKSKQSTKMKIAESDISFESQSKEPSQNMLENTQGLFKFNRKKNNNKNEINDQSQILDAKLNHITNEKVKQKKEEKSQMNQKKKIESDEFYTSYTERDNLPRYKLPCVPSVIKVPENPKLREQTETQMIKRLITSYFNVVKKNINDLVPKSIVTFLVNHTRNSCQKIIVNNLYVQKEFDSLLHEKEYILVERERLTKDCSTLRECLDLINSLQSQLSI